MPDIHQIESYLKEILDPDNINDSSLNGIQLENGAKNIKKIAFAVDASLASIQGAIKNECDLLIVHHGLFWGKPLPIRGILRKRIKLMLENDIGLIAYHLPLDAHKCYGNNIQILKKISDDSLETLPFGNYHGVYIGWQIEIKKPILIDEIYKRLGILADDKSLKYLDFGNKAIKKIASVSGGGKSCFEEAISKNIDLFITGDPSHELYHTAKENKINILFAGHYFTETFGVKALKNLIKNKFNIDTSFIDIPTGL